MKSKYFILLFLIILCSCSKKQEQKVEPLSKNAIEALNVLNEKKTFVDDASFSNIKKRIENYDRGGNFWKYAVVVYVFLMGFMALLVSYLMSSEERKRPFPIWKGYLLLFTGGFFGIHKTVICRWDGFVNCILFWALFLFNFSTIMIYWIYPKLLFYIPEYNLFTRIIFLILVLMLVLDFFLIPYYVFRYNANYFRKNKSEDRMLIGKSDSYDSANEIVNKEIGQVNKDLENINIYVKEDYFIEDPNKDKTFWGSLTRGAKSVITFGNSNKLEMEMNRLRCLSACCDELGDLYDSCQFCNEELSDRLISSRIAVYRNLYLAKELIGIVKNKLSTKQQSLLVDYYFKCDMPKYQMNINGIANLDVSFNSEVFLDSLGSDLTVIFDNLNTKLENESLSKKDFVDAAVLTGLNVFVNGLSAIIDLNIRTKEARSEVQTQTSNALLYIDEAVIGIQEYQKYILRQKEILEALEKANIAFIQAYVPLREQVFGKPTFWKFLTGIPKNRELFKTNEFREDLQHLILVCTEYSKINQSKI